MTPEDLLYVKVTEDMVTKPVTSKATYACWYSLAVAPEAGVTLILDREHQELVELEDYEVVGTIVIFHTLPLFPIEICYGAPNPYLNMPNGVTIPWPIPHPGCQGVVIPSQTIPNQYPLIYHDPQGLPYVDGGTLYGSSTQRWCSSGGSVGVSNNSAILSSHSASMVMQYAGAV